MPRTAKQYFRWFLVKFGLFDEKAFRLAIDEVRADDIFLVSFPKSGNTWLRFIIANLLTEKEVNFRNIDEFVPDIYSATEKVNDLPSPRFIKTHHTYFDIFPKCIYIVRDYRDVLVSYYNYHEAIGEFSGNFSAYVKKVNTLHPFGTWHDHTDAALAFAKQNPRRILFLKYEDLLENTAECVKRIIAFAEIENKTSVADVIAKSNFSELRKKEDHEGSQFRDISGKYFFRQGKSGEWKNVIDEESLEFILKENGKMLITLGYETGK